MKYPQIKTGSFTILLAENGAAKTINLGFVPDFVMVRNVTQGIQMDLFATEVAEHGLKTWASSTYHNFLTEGGLKMVDTTTISASDPVRKTKVQGFEIPLALINTGDVVHWMTIRVS
jgi:hypothetical protein